MASHDDSNKPPEIDDLLAPAKARDRLASQELFEALRPPITRYCYSRIGKSPSASADAEDVVQEVLAGAAVALPHYQSNGSGFLAFVFGIAANKIADFHRKYTRERSALFDPPEVPDPEVGPEEATLRVELSERVQELLSILPTTQRTVLVLRVAAGLSTAETAEIVSSTPGSVRVTQHRALTKLRRRLSQPCS